MLLNLSDLSSEPLYSQIIRQIRAQVLSGSIDPGTPLPSIRDLARAHKVSVITVQKAYDDLVRDHLLIPRRGKGYFVADMPKSGKVDLARSHCLDAMKKPVADALQEGLSPRDIRKILEQTIADIRDSDDHARGHSL